MNEMLFLARELSGYIVSPALNNVKVAWVAGNGSTHEILSFVLERMVACIVLRLGIPSRGGQRADELGRTAR